MSLAGHFSHRPPIPTIEEILSDLESSKDKRGDDPVFAVSDNEVETTEIIFEDEHVEKDLASRKRERERRKEICDTYDKVAEFLEQNENLTNSMKSMNELSKELHTKKENLTQLIMNIKQSMKDEKS